MIRIVSVVFLVGVIGALSVSAFRLHGQKTVYERELLEASVYYEELRTEQDRVSGDVEYYKNDANLSKELRSRFNYREPGEELIILVPEE